MEVPNIEKLNEANLNLLKFAKDYEHIQNNIKYNIQSGGKKCQYRCGFCDECFNTSEQINRHIMYDCRYSRLIQRKSNTIDTLSDSDLHKKIFEICGITIPIGMSRNKMIAILNLFNRIFHQNIQKRELQVYLDQALRIIIFQKQVQPYQGTIQAPQIFQSATRIQELEAQIAQLQQLNQSLQSNSSYDKNLQDQLRQCQLDKTKLEAESSLLLGDIQKYKNDISQFYGGIYTEVLNNLLDLNRAMFQHDIQSSTKVLDGNIDLVRKELQNPNYDQKMLNKFIINLEEYKNNYINNLKKIQDTERDLEDMLNKDIEYADIINLFQFGTDDYIEILISNKNQIQTIKKKLLKKQQILYDSLSLIQFDNHNVDFLNEDYFKDFAYYRNVNNLQNIDINTTLDKLKEYLIFLQLQINDANKTNVEKGNIKALIEEYDSVHNFRNIILEIKQLSNSLNLCDAMGDSVKSAESLLYKKNNESIFDQTFNKVMRIVKEGGNKKQLEQEISETKIKLKDCNDILHNNIVSINNGIQNSGLNKNIKDKFQDLFDKAFPQNRNPKITIDQYLKLIYQELIKLKDSNDDPQLLKKLNDIQNGLIYTTDQEFNPQLLDKSRTDIENINYENDKIAWDSFYGIKKNNFKKGNSIKNEIDSLLNFVQYHNNFINKLNIFIENLTFEVDLLDNLNENLKNDYSNIENKLITFKNTYKLEFNNGQKSQNMSIDDIFNELNTQLQAMLIQINRIDSDYKINIQSNNLSYIVKKITDLVNNNMKVKGQIQDVDKQIKELEKITVENMILGSYKNINLTNIPQNIINTYNDISNFITDISSEEFKFMENPQISREIKYKFQKLYDTVNLISEFKSLSVAYIKNGEHLDTKLYPLINSTNNKFIFNLLENIKKALNNSDDYNELIKLSIGDIKNIDWTKQNSNTIIKAESFLKSIQLQLLEYDNFKILFDKILKLKPNDIINFNFTNTSNDINKFIALDPTNLIKSFLEDLQTELNKINISEELNKIKTLTLEKIKNDGHNKIVPKLSPEILELFDNIKAELDELKDINDDIELLNTKPLKNIISSSNGIKNNDIKLFINRIKPYIELQDITFNTTSNQIIYDDNKIDKSIAKILEQANQKIRDLDGQIKTSGASQSELQNILTEIQKFPNPINITRYKGNQTLQDNLNKAGELYNDSLKIDNFLRNKETYDIDKNITNDNLKKIMKAFQDQFKNYLNEIKEITSILNSLDGNIIPKFKLIKDTNLQKAIEKVNDKIKKCNDDLNKEKDKLKQLQTQVDESKKLLTQAITDIQDPTKDSLATNIIDNLKQARDNIANLPNLSSQQITVDPLQSIQDIEDAIKKLEKFRSTEEQRLKAEEKRLAEEERKRKAQQQQDIEIQAENDCNNSLIKLNEYVKDYLTSQLVRDSTVTDAYKKYIDYLKLNKDYNNNQPFDKTKCQSKDINKNKLGEQYYKDYLNLYKNNIIKDFESELKIEQECINDQIEVSKYAKQFVDHTLTEDEKKSKTFGKYEKYLELRLVYDRNQKWAQKNYQDECKNNKNYYKDYLITYKDYLVKNFRKELNEEFDCYQSRDLLKSKINNLNIDTKYLSTNIYKTIYPKNVQPLLKINSNCEDPSKNKKEYDTQFSNLDIKFKEFLRMAQKEIDDNAKGIIKCDTDLYNEKYQKYKSINDLTSKILIIKNNLRNTRDPGNLLNYAQEIMDPNDKQKKIYSDKLLNELKNKSDNVNKIRNNKKKIIEIETDNPQIFNNSNQQKDQTIIKEYRRLCDEIKRLITELNIDDIDNLYKDLLNIYEDISGSVRVFIRINNKKGTIYNASTTNTYIYPPRNEECSKEIIYKGGNNCGSINEQRYGPFYAVYMNTDNKQIYEGILEQKGQTTGDNLCNLIYNPLSGLKNTIQQVESGYTIVLQVYGFSGSGKTFTLFGSPESKIQGIINYTFGDSKFKPNTIKINKISELYGLGLPTKDYYPALMENIKNPDTSQNFKRYIYTPFGQLNLDYNKLLEDSINKFNNANTTDDKNNIMNELIEILEIYRKIIGSIKETTNNPESSRGHLFIEFKIGIGKLIVIDSGGIENPFNIIETYFNNIKDDLGNSVINITVDKIGWKKYLPSDSTFDSFKQKIFLDLKLKNAFDIKAKQDWNKMIYKLDKSNQKIIKQTYTIKDFIDYLKIINILKTFNNKLFIEFTKNIEGLYQNNQNISITIDSNSITKIKQLFNTLTKKQIDQIFIMYKLFYNMGFDNTIPTTITKQRDINFEIFQNYKLLELMIILQEGFYINETLNHMKAYFQYLKLGKQNYSVNDQSVEINFNDSAILKQILNNNNNYTPFNTFYYPQFTNDITTNQYYSLYYTGGDYKLPQFKNKTADEVGMITELIKIKRSGGKNKPSKFTLISLINPEQEKKYCEGSLATLNFSQIIASTI